MATKPTMQVRMKPELHRELKLVAEQEGRTMTEVIRRALRLYGMASR